MVTWIPWQAEFSGGSAAADEQQPPEREAELHKSARQPYVRYRTEPPARSGYCS